MEPFVVEAEFDPRRFGRYLLAQKIAQGGMASVHLAQLKGEGKFSKWVAVKVVHPQYAGQTRFERMFLNEARLLARIDHPNVCSVFDFGEVHGIFYLAMEYLHGQPLQRLMAQAQSEPGFLSHSCAARIIADAADGLHAAHELVTESGSLAKVVHRDVSPSNLVVLYSGVTKVLDFGIAHSNDRDEEFTSVDEIKGKLAYMAPEQLRREELDRRSDIFSLGIVLWELTCGRRLFRRNNEGETVVALLQEPIPLPSSVMPGYPESLERIVMRALARDRDQRYATAVEMARELELFISENGRSVGHSHVADAMKSLFGREIEVHTSSLRRSADLLRKIEGLSVPDLEVDIEVGERIEPSSSAVLARGRKRRVLWGAAACLGIAAVAGGTYLKQRGTPSNLTAPLVTPPVGAPVLAAPQPGPLAPATTPPATMPPATTPPTTAPPTTAPPTTPAVEPSLAAGARPAVKKPEAKGAARTRPLPPAPLAVAAPASPAPAAPVPKEVVPAAKVPHAPAGDDDKSPRPMTSFE